MEASDLEKLKYPIGKFTPPKQYTPEYLSAKILEISSFPQRLKSETIHLSDLQLDTRYRPDGWTLRQVIHHCAESHMNCFIRLKWTLTENNPVIKAYDETLWSDLSDSIQMPIQPSLTLLEGLHFRLAYLMTHVSQADLDKTFIHPENNSEYSIKQMIGTYAWHGNHHLAQIIKLKKEKSWN